MNKLERLIATIDEQVARGEFPEEEVASYILLASAVWEAEIDAFHPFEMYGEVFVIPPELYERAE